MFELVTIPAGWFWMGEDDGLPDSRPRHRVWVDAFRIGRYPVTNAEYARHLEATGAAPPPFFGDPNFSRPRQPVVAVSWPEAAAFCAWLAAETGLALRLPTEAEWEKAARGGLEDAPYPWGDAPPEALPWWPERMRPDRPARVGGLPPNGYGLHDMEGIVHEWCQDWYDPVYYARSPERNPQGPPSGDRKVSRGGAWRHQIPVSRCAHRSSLPPHLRYADYGFRVAASER